MDRNYFCSSKTVSLSQSTPTQHLRHESAENVHHPKSDGKKGYFQSWRNLLLLYVKLPQSLLLAVYFQRFLSPALFHFASIVWNRAEPMRGKTLNRLQSTGWLSVLAWLQSEHLAGTLIRGDVQWLIRQGAQGFAWGLSGGTHGYLWRLWEHACNLSCFSQATTLLLVWSLCKPSHGSSDRSHFMHVV